MRGGAPPTTDDLVVDPFSTDTAGSMGLTAAVPAATGREGRQHGAGLELAAPAAGQRDR